MKPAQTPSTENQRPLIGRSTIVILMSYQIGMLIGNGMPRTIAAGLFLAVTVGLVSFLGSTLIRQETAQRREADKRQRIARRVDRRLQAYIIDPPARSPKAPIQPRLRKETHFMPVVNNWS